MAFSLSDICSKNLTKSHRHPYGIRSDGVRNPIGRRTESNRAANASGGKNLKKNPQHLLCRHCGQRIILLCFYY